MTSPLIRQALNRIAELRAEHRLMVQSDYERAETETNGAMLNERGKSRGIDPYSLFTHNPTYFRAYASEELIEWREANPHLSFERYEKLMTETEPF